MGSVIYCEYNKHFSKLRNRDRILSVPVLKNTCIECKYKKECPIPNTNNPRHNNKYLIKNLLVLKNKITEDIREYYRIQKDIRDGKYIDSYKFKYITLEEVKDKDDSVIYVTSEDGLTDEYTVKEYLEAHPHDLHKKKLVGYKRVETVADVVYGLDIIELEEDLEYINEELRRLNKDNGVVINV